MHQVKSNMAMAYTDRRDLDSFYMDGIPPYHAEKLYNFMYGSANCGGYGTLYNIPDNASLQIFTYELTGRTRCGWELRNVDDRQRYVSQYLVSGTSEYPRSEPIPKQKQKPKSNKIEKAPKHVRHQFLRKRLKEKNK